MSEFILHGGRRVRVLCGIVTVFRRIVALFFIKKRVHDELHIISSADWLHISSSDWWWDLLLPLV